MLRGQVPLATMNYIYYDNATLFLFLFLSLVFSFCRLRREFFNPKGATPRVVIYSRPRRG